MKYDFGKVVDRKNTNCLKHDFAVARGKAPDAIPLWIADMDFMAPTGVIEALANAATHGVFGYSETAEAYDKVLQDWFKRRFNWHIQPEWNVKSPGVVTALHIIIQGLTQPGEGVLIQQPVYPPFYSSITTTGRKPVINQLVKQEDSYVIDFDDFEAKAKTAKLFILCSPHNPVGRVWTRDELTCMGDICLKHGVTVVADEIHGDLILDGRKQFIFADLKPEYLDITVTCTAPSKTFNVAGLQLANVFIANENLRKKVQDKYTENGLSQSNLMGIVACEAAYKYGEDWLEELLMYLAGNRDFVQGYLSSELPNITMTKLEGTYLAWLDFSKLGLSPTELDNFISHKARLWLTDGQVFGAGGEGFQRVNIGCAQKVLFNALERLRIACSTLV